MWVFAELTVLKMVIGLSGVQFQDTNDNDNDNNERFCKTFKDKKLRY